MFIFISLSGSLDVRLSSSQHAKWWPYGVLGQVSLGYPPVRGRLHTRYAPVRRSSPEYCYSALPLDLHVLSLPLAFILSQDQTLHCKNCLYFSNLWLNRVSASEDALDTRYLLFPIFQSSLASFSEWPRFFSKAVAKIRPFSKLPNFFFIHRIIMIVI